MMIHRGLHLITIKSKNMFNNKQEYIVCSAILKIEETEQLPIYNSFENDLHKICIGLRHADILYQHRGIVSKNPYHQGFFTSKARYVDRMEAMEIALDCGQVTLNELTNPRFGLFSEDIY